MRTNLGQKGQIAIYVIIAIVLVSAIVLVGILMSGDEPEKLIIECETSDECVPSECCNAVSCVPVGLEPNCTGVSCIGDFCESSDSGKLGCGPPQDRGNCSCINNKCEPVFNNA